MVLAALLLAPPDFSAYKTWTLVTPQAVDMAPAIAISCIGPASWDASKDNPHLKKRFRVWVNPVGKATMAAPTDRMVDGGWKPIASRFPEGTVIVKEKFDASLGRDFERKPVPLPPKPELLTIMVKGRAGSKPETHDWTYLVADGLLKRIDASQETRCAGCHGARPERDFTFRDYGRLTH